MKRRGFTLVLLGLLTLCYGRLQAEDVYHTVNYHIETVADVSQGDHLPYFMAANSYGVLSPQGSQGFLRAAVHYNRQREERKFYFGAGADMIAYVSSHNDYYRNNSYLQQCYLEVGSGEYFITAGIKEQPARFVDSHLSSGNMVWSNNSRPVPGLHIGTRDFVKMFIIADLLESSFDFFYGKLLDGDFNNHRFDQYQALGDKGPLRASAFDGAYLHRKSVWVRTPSKYPFYITFGVEHAALFGGKIKHIDGKWDASRELVTFDQTCKWGNALLGGEGRTDDALNHLMTLDARMDFRAEKFDFALYKQHYTDDLNAKSFSNFADGLWGMELKLKRFPWLNHVVMEFIKTNSQGDNTEALKKFASGTETTVDDFASDFYQDQRFGGYAYYGMACGHPMVTSPIYNADLYPGYLYNNMQGIHLGAEGSINDDFSYRVKFCNIKSDGNPWTSALEKINGQPVSSYTNTSCHVEACYKHKSWNYGVQLSIDNGDLYGNNFGIGLSARYSGTMLKTIWK